jgi:hypothetical protein
MSYKRSERFNSNLQILKVKVNSKKFNKNLHRGEQEKHRGPQRRSGEE